MTLPRMKSIYLHHLKSLLGLALPIMLANLAQSAYQTVDAYWIAKLGVQDVAAAGAAAPLTFMLLSLGLGFALSGSTLAAHAFGAGDTPRLRSVAGGTLVLTSGLGVLIAMAFWLSGGGWLYAAGIPKAVVPMVLGYMRITVLGFVLLYGYIAYQSLMRAVGKTRIPLLLVVGTVVLNFGLDPLLMFGAGPIPPLGLYGAAYATLISQALVFAIALTELFRKSGAIGMRLSDLRAQGGLIWRIVKLGAPSSLENLVVSSGLSALVFVVAHFGADALAAWGAASRALSLVIIPAMGLGAAISALVGRQFGAGEPHKVPGLGLTGAALGFVVMGVSGVAVHFEAQGIAAFFIATPGAAQDLASQFIQLSSLAFAFVGLRMALLGLLRGSGRSGVAMTVSIISAWGIQIPLAGLLAYGLGWGVSGIAMAMPLFNLMAAILAVGTVWVLLREGAESLSKLPEARNLTSAR